MCTQALKNWPQELFAARIREQVDYYLKQINREIKAFNPNER